MVILGLVVVLGCGQLQKQISDKLPTAIDDSSPNFSLAGKEWKTFDLESMDISVELPGEPADRSPAASQLPPGSKAIFEAVKIHAYENKDFTSSYSQLELTGKQKFEIKDLADKAMTAIRNQARDLKYTVDVTSDSKAKYDGTFSRNGKVFEVKGCCIYQKTKPERVWSVITVAPQGNADAQTASQRIINSATFASSSDTCQ